MALLNKIWMTDVQYRQAGFSLLELLVTVAIATIILSIAVPAFTESTQRNRINNYADQLYTSIKTAQSQALRLRTTVSMCAANFGTKRCVASNDWSDGWYSFLDADKDGVINQDDDILFAYQTTKSISIIGKSLDADDGVFISFSAEGLLFNLPDAVATIGDLVGNIYICTPGNADSGRQITLDANFSSDDKAAPRFSNITISGAGLCLLS